MIRIALFHATSRYAVTDFFRRMTDRAVSGQENSYGIAVRRTRRLAGTTLVFAGFLLGVAGCTDHSIRQTIEFSETSLPVSGEVVLALEGASAIRLPNGKTIALWHTQRVDLTGPFGKGGPEFEYGEKPFVPLQRETIRLPGGGTSPGEYLSYIRQGPVIYENSESPTKYVLYVDKYRVTLRPTGSDKGKLRMTASVEIATENEKVPRHQQREHHLARLKSGDPAVRRDAAHELGMMVALGSHDAGDPAQIAEAIRPLLADPDANVREEAKIRLRVMGDEEALLEMLAPKPEGEFFAKNGAWTIAAWCREKRSQEAVCRRVMEYFQSDDPAMLEFALAFFSMIEYPQAKPHILKGLKSPHAAVRESATEAVRKYGSP